jgi:hypothetical protein
MSSNRVHQSGREIVKKIGTGENERGKILNLHLQVITGNRIQGSKITS